MEGTLEKLTNNKLGLNYYKRRHFRLEWSKLKYYARPDDDTEKGSIDLAELHGAYLCDQDSHRKTIVLAFGNRSVFLLAPDPEEAAAWVYNLRSYSKRNQPADPIPMPRHIARSLLVLITSCKKHRGTQQEGLFRVPGGAPQIKSICRSVYLNRSTILTPHEARDVESTAGAIKRLLWCLPEPLFTKARVGSMIKAQDAETTRRIILEMPVDNQVVINNLCGLLKEVCDNTDSTKMTPLSLAMCFSPCLSGAESGAILDMKPLFNVIIGHYTEIFHDLPLVMDDDESLTMNTDCLPKTLAARAINTVLAENGGDSPATLKRDSPFDWNSIRPRVASIINSKPQSVKPRPSIPSFLEANPRLDQAKIADPPATAIVALTSLSQVFFDDDDADVAPKVQKQLDHLRNRVHELEERCAYWRNKAEAAEAALSSVSTLSMQALPRKSLKSAVHVIRTGVPSRAAPQSEDEISSEDGNTTDDEAFRTALPQIHSFENDVKTDDDISDLSDEESSIVTPPPLELTSAKS